MKFIKELVSIREGRGWSQHSSWSDRGSWVENEEQHNGIISWFQENPDPTADELEAFAKEQGYNLDELNTRVYALLSSLLRGVGKNNTVPDEEFDQDQLERGIETEMEHTDDPLVAKMIAKDHLMEIPDYYDRLERMEKEAGVEHEADPDEYEDPEGGIKFGRM